MEIEIKNTTQWQSAEVTNEQKDYLKTGTAKNKATATQTKPHILPLLDPAAVHMINTTARNTSHQNTRAH